MKKRLIFTAVTAAITACLALCAAVWPQAETVEKTPAPSETTAVTTPRPTLPEPEELILPAITERQESGMPEAESAPEVAAKELAQMLGHYRPTITRQNYEPYLPHKVQKDESMPNEATQSELQQAANILDNLLKF